VLGQVAALGTAACWAAGSYLFTIAARRLGSLTLNQARITLALVFLSAFTFAARGTAWAPEAAPRQILFLVVSGLVGLTLGDWAYFRALVAIGPRLGTLLMTLAPPLTAILAVPVLHERLSWVGIAGMAVTIAGVGWVVLERSAVPIPRGHRVLGVAMGALGSLGQAVGLILSKIGMGNEIDPLPATAIRMAAATAGIWLVAGLSRRARNVRLLRTDRTARLAVLGACLLGPVTGVWLSLVAVRLTEAGIAATLMSTTPVLVLPLVMFVGRERVSPRAAFGALVAVAGVGMLFLR